MRESWQDTFSVWWYRSLPFIISVIMLLFSFIPLNSELANNARPAVGLMCAYFWLVYRPDLFNMFSVFILGFISDVISLSPIGSSIISYLLMYVLVMHLIRYLNGKAFIVIWSGLALLLAAALLIKWVVLSIYYNEILPFGILIFSYMVSLAIYPVIGWVNALVLNRYLRDDY